MKFEVKIIGIGRIDNDWLEEDKFVNAPTPMSYPQIGMTETIYETNSRKNCIKSEIMKRINMILDVLQIINGFLLIELLGTDQIWRQLPGPGDLDIGKYTHIFSYQLRLCLQIWKNSNQNLHNKAWKLLKVESYNLNANVEWVVILLESK